MLLQGCQAQWLRRTSSSFLLKYERVSNPSSHVLVACLLGHWQVISRIGFLSCDRESVLSTGSRRKRERWHSNFLECFGELLEKRRDGTCSGDTQSFQVPHDTLLCY